MFKNKTIFTIGPLENNNGPQLKYTKGPLDFLYK